MAEVRPFRGIIYNTDKVAISDVVAPPYDVINERMQEELYNRSPYNVVRLILGRVYPEDDEKNNRYTRARSFLDEWLRSGILKRLRDEAFFVYHQTFSFAGRTYTRKALLGRVRLEPLGEGSIIPHEKTLSAPKKDRLMLFKATEMNLSPVFGIALDDGDFFSEVDGADKKPLFEFEDPDGVMHSFYTVSSRDAIDRISGSLKDKRILIADGHHRYETALAYQREMMEKDPDYSPDAPYNFVMMAVVSSKDPGLLVLPIHRVIKNLNFNDYADRIKGSFPVVREVLGAELNNVTDLLRSFGERHYLFYEPDDGFVFRVDDASDELDVVVLHQEVLHGVLGITEEEIKEKRKIEYFKNINEALDFLSKGGQFILSYIPPTVEEIAAYSLSGKIMPQKSTYFYPKFYSGLVFYSLRD